MGKSGEKLESHSQIPTAEQRNAMAALVDAMDLSTTGETDE